MLQALRYREQNKELKRIGRAQERQDKAKLKEEVEELRAQLDNREVELKVRRHQAARTNKLLLHPQDLLRRQEILVKSQRRQMGVEMRKR